MINRRIIHKILVLLLLFPVIEAQGQEKVKMQSYMLGIGRANQYDSYLSPMEYKGPQINLLHESLRMTHWAGEKVSFQQLTEVACSLTENPAHNANDWAGRASYDAAWHYNWMLPSHLRILAGGMMGGNLGFLYNDRNGNNPAQARCDLHLAASLAGVWDFSLWKHTFYLRYQADVPILGAMFSPEYGESYYEIASYGKGGHVKCTYPGNALCLRQMLTLDIPVRKSFIRIGYLSRIHQSHVNQIEAHDIARSFSIGYMRGI